MADNAQKRELVNTARLILNAGRTSAAGLFFESIDDTEFADWSTVTGKNDLRAACKAYEEILLKVLNDIKPEWATKYADLGAPVKVNKESGEWSYLFELPSDYDSRLKETICQINQTDRKTKYDFDILHFESYAHIVTGSDDQTYYCSTAHTSSSATAPITGANYSTYWTLYDEDDIGAPHSTYSFAYKADNTADLLATNDLSNAPSATVDNDIDSAYISYIPYSQAGINDKPQYYSEHFKNAFCTRLAAELAIDTKDYARRRLLLQEYYEIAKPDCEAIATDKKYRPSRVSIYENSKNLSLP